MTASLSKSAARFAVLVLCTLTGVSFMAGAAGATSPGSPPPPLQVDQAFPLTASLVDGKLALQVDVLPGHYLYRDRFEFRLDDRDLSRAVLAKMAKGKIKNDPHFGKVAVYEQPLKIDVSAKTVAPSQLTVVFQGCSEVSGICYPPATRVFALTSGVKGIKAKDLEPISLKDQFRKQVSQ